METTESVNESASAGLSRKAIWADFCADTKLQRAHKITSNELHAMSRMAMLGSFGSKTDLLFALKIIRSARR